MATEMFAQKSLVQETSFVEMDCMKAVDWAKQFSQVNSKKKKKKEKVIEKEKTRGK